MVKGAILKEPRCMYISKFNTTNLSQILAKIETSE